MLASLATGFTAAVAMSATDGPYVMKIAQSGFEAWTVSATADGPRKHVAPVAKDGTVMVAGVDALPAFRVKLRAPADPAPDTVAVPARSPIFVVADTHGEFEILAQMLQSQKVIDARLRWTLRPRAPGGAGRRVRPRA